MAIIRLDLASDATWQKAWVIDTLAELAAFALLFATPLGPKRGDVALCNEDNRFYLFVGNNAYTQITGIAYTDKQNTFSEQQTFTANFGILLQRNGPVLELWDSSQAADARSILLTNGGGAAGGGFFEIAKSNDAHSAILSLLNMERSTGNWVSLGTIETQGGSIIFPATEVPSANANALDDYQEGTFTTAITFGGLSTGITYAANTFSYTKIGRQVCCCGVIVLSSKGSATGDVAFTLPFAVSSGNEFASANGLNFDAMAVTVNNAIASCINGTNTAFVFQTAAGTTTRLNDTNFTNSSVLVVQVNFFTG